MTDSHIGTRLYISTTLPATNDAAGFEALTWTEVKGLIQGPQFGVNDNVIDVPDLSSGFGSGVKGMGMGQASEMTFRDVSGDAGQAALLAAANTPNGIVAVKLGRARGALDADRVPALDAGDVVEYAQGFCYSPMANQPTGDSYEGFSVSFRQNKQNVTATEPV